MRLFALFGSAGGAKPIKVQIRIPGASLIVKKLQ
jgi:hypothetical protein